MGELHVSAPPREGDAKAGIQFFSGSHWEVSVPAFAGMRGGEGGRLLLPVAARHHGA